MKKKNKILCFGCGKEVAECSNLKGITTWFSMCSECLFGVKGWTREELSPIWTKHGQEQRDKLRDKMLKKAEKEDIKK